VTEIIQHVEYSVPMARAAPRLKSLKTPPRTGELAYANSHE
jgi:hypothetical protein